MVHVIIFSFYPISFACFVVAIYDLVHSLDTVFYLCYKLTASVIHFGDMIDARKPASGNFPGIIHSSDAVGNSLHIEH